MKVAHKHTVTIDCRDAPMMSPVYCHKSGLRMFFLCLTFGCFIMVGISEELSRLFVCLILDTLHPKMFTSMRIKFAKSLKIVLYLERQ